MGNPGTDHRSRILIVEDDPAIMDSLSTGLELEGYSPVPADSAESALELLNAGQVAIALLDVRLPGIDGFALCRKLREQGERFPIIMLTARDEEVDKILGLEMGADDYMVKPYSFRELLSRIRAHLRRAGEYGREPEDGTSAEVFEFGDVRIDFSAFRARRNDREVELTPIEMRLMHCFYHHQDQILGREQIVRQVWGENYYLEDQRTVDVHIRHLREKLEEDPSSPRYIQTVRSLGYRFVKKS